MVLKFRRSREPERASATLVPAVMATMDDPFESLMRHRAFVRAIARAVLDDGALAEDVVQQTWIVARDADVASPGFLATIARHLAINLRRSRDRRAARELRYEAPPATPSPQQILELEEERRRVVGAVLGLEEPYRSVVLLRFYEDLPPRAIAARLGVPVETVKTRLKRAQQRLRSALMPGESEQPHRALLALAAMDVPQLPWVATLGGLLMGAKGLAVVGVLGVAVLWFGARDREGESPTPAAPTVQVTGSGATAEAPEVAAAPTRERADGIDQPRAPLGLTGRVIDEDGDPIHGAHVRLWSDSGSDWSRATKTEVDGSFAFVGLDDAPREGPWVVGASGAGRVAKSIKVGAPESGVLHLGVIALERSGAIHGRVVDTDGVPVAGARVVVASSWTEVHAAWLRFDLDGGVRAVTDAAGRFQIDGIEPGWVVVGARGEDSWIGAVDAIPVRARRITEDVVIIVERPRSGIRLRGRLEDERGAPIPHASLLWSGKGRDGTAVGKWNWSSTLATDDRGAFDLTCGIDAVHALRYTAPDGRTVQRDGLVAGGPDVVLRLPDAPRVTVHAVDATTRDPIVLRSGRVSTEDEAGGFAVRATSTGFFVAPPAAPWSLTVRASGYDVVTVGPYPANMPTAPIEVTMRATPRVQGVVVDPDGAPVARATVTWSEPLAAPMEAMGFVVHWAQHRTSSVRTAEDGSFAIEVPPELERAALDVAAPGLASARSELLELRARGADASPHRIRMTRGGTITGEVLTPTRIERAGIVVAASCGDGVPRTTRTDEMGRFVLHAVPAGRWRVELREDDVFGGSLYGTIRAAPEPNAIVTEGLTMRIDLALHDRMDPTVVGVVRIDGAARPLVRAMLVERNSEGETSAEDAWQFAHVVAEPVEADADGAFELVSSRSGRQWLEIQIAAGSTSRALRYDQFLVSGERRVDVDVRTGTIELVPRADASPGRLLLYGVAEDGARMRMDATLDGPGVLQLPLVPAGTWTLVAPEGPRGPFEVRPGETTRIPMD